jgi:sugar lactone lactonase YvrE
VVLAVFAACTDAVEAPPASALFVADRTANRIVRFDGVTGAYEAVVATIDRPSSVLLGPDGSLYVAGFGRSEITRIGLENSEDLGRFYQDTAVLEEPVELLFRGSELVVLGHDTHNAIVIDASGSMVRDVGYPDMRGAHDFVFGADGLLYVAAEHDVVSGMALQIWDVELGTIVGRFGSLDQIANATGVVRIEDALYVTDYERGHLLRFDREQSTVLVTGLAHPISLELGPDGLLYVIDDWGIQQFERDGTQVALFVARGPHLVGPRSLTFVAR